MRRGFSNLKSQIETRSNKFQKPAALQKACLMDSDDSDNVDLEKLNDELEEEGTPTFLKKRSGSVREVNKVTHKKSLPNLSMQKNKVETEKVENK